MPTRLYQFVSTATGSSSIQMVTSGRIVGVLWSLRQETTASGDGIRAELSQQGFSQWTQSNAQGIISFANLIYYQGTNVGLARGDANFFHGGLDLPISQGDLIYLNVTITGATAFAKALLTVLER